MTAGKPRKRTTENTEFDAFARRILRAYARRVAAGDVEALAALTGLSAELDAVTRLAVAGLRGKPYSYSWGEIANRLGVSRQAAQMRYGDRTYRHALDHRLLEATITVTVATLVQVFTGHHPGNQAPTRCPGRGYPYPDGTSACPTNATVRPLLLRRRGEDPDAVARLNPVQFADLHHRTTTRLRAAVRQAATPAPDQPVPTLFDTGKDLAS